MLSAVLAINLLCYAELLESATVFNDDIFQSIFHTKLDINLSNATNRTTLHNSSDSGTSSTAETEKNFELYCQADYIKVPLFGYRVFVDDSKTSRHCEILTCSRNGNDVLSYPCEEIISPAEDNPTYYEACKQNNCSVRKKDIFYYGDKFLEFIQGIR